MATLTKGEPQSIAHDLYYGRLIRTILKLEDKSKVVIMLCRRDPKVGEVGIPREIDPNLLIGREGYLSEE